MKKIIPFLAVLFFIISCNKDKNNSPSNSEEKKIELSSKDVAKDLSFVMGQTLLSQKTAQIISDANLAMEKFFQANPGEVTQTEVKCPLGIGQSAFMASRSFLDGDCPNRIFLLKVRWVVSEGIRGWCPGPIENTELASDYTFTLTTQIGTLSPSSVSWVSTAITCGSGGQQFYTAHYTFDVYFEIDEPQYSVPPYYFDATAVNNNCSAIPLTPANLQVDKTINYCTGVAVGGVSRVPSTSTNAVVFTECAVSCPWPWTVCPNNGNFKYRIKNSGNPWTVITIPQTGLFLTGLSSSSTYEYELILNYGAPYNCSSLVKTGQF